MRATLRTEVVKEPGLDPMFPTPSDHGYSLQACHRMMTRIDLKERDGGNRSGRDGLRLNLVVFDFLPRYGA